MDQESRLTTHLRKYELYYLAGAALLVCLGAGVLITKRTTPVIMIEGRKFCHHRLYSLKGRDGL